MALFRSWKRMWCAKLAVFGRRGSAWCSQRSRPSDLPPPLGVATFRENLWWRKPREGKRCHEGRSSQPSRSSEKLREAEGGLAQGKTVPEAVQKPGVTEQTHCRWRRAHGGLRTDQAKQRQTVEHVRDTLGRDVVTERRACRVIGQAGNTQRRGACVADDEPQLAKRIGGRCGR